ncbi:hypothetical protein DOS84_15195 [Flavobacterium aquariorum]|uniref:Uncharacterized protein n=1 Tax=Flavobacterium aquariorum TaxID=2217670 RepID=A0A2W7UGI4_9FLAO|nr:hypothetical protein DOS84_15195 [Flavobacterium aquariorum]
MFLSYVKKVHHFLDTIILHLNLDYRDNLQTIFLQYNQNLCLPNPVIHP